MPCCQDADVAWHCWNTGNVGDNMGDAPASKAVEHLPTLPAAQQATPAKANWRQARPPKAASIKQEQPDPDLQARAAFLAGMLCLSLL